MPILDRNRFGSILTLALILTVLSVSSSATAQTKTPAPAQSSNPEKVRNVDFCTLLRKPYSFMDQTVRIRAMWETFNKFSFLNGIHCRAEYIERLKTSFVDQPDKAIMSKISQMQSLEFGSRAMITAVGILRDPSRGEGPALLFEILRFEDVAPVVTPSSDEQSNSADVPTIDFCDLVRQPRRYFDQRVRIVARWDSGHEFSYLNDDRCPVKFRYEIGVNFGGAGPDEAIRKNVSTIQSREYGGRAMITAVGILRNPGRYYGYYRYSFEILKFENVVHVVTPYQGTLETGKTYRATVRGYQAWGLVPVPALQMVFHQSVYIGWTNLSDFPELAKLREDSQRQIVFSVISDKIQRMTERRWNRSLECKIIRIE